MSAGFANTPAPSYWAVIFTSKRTADERGYAAMSEAMMERALAHPGCLGAESARGAGGLGITVAYDQDEALIAAWRADGPHQAAQKQGIERCERKLRLEADLGRGEPS